MPHPDLDRLGTPPPSGAFTVSEFAKAYRLSTRFVWRLIEAKKLEVIRPGRRATRIEVAAAERYLAQLRTKGW